ncbi:hypothetical protein [Flavisolibacter ginsenosidimutans]|uniref:ZU5 domain-containing protein n=1 Tax=Flavisolibacter ginsenosidimutans TaxID=661481 RepID=A0A5B8UM19_9BACT|nr:hypothetical protein [Flavisolibacter ginsenosidimutans]QEC57110.1 hypothetical protein FSB75_14765 [Flavisolibacter ginsenosidimutans]
MQLRNLCFLLLLTAFCQCKKGDTEKPGITAAEQVKRDHGQLTGASVKQSIGVAGGSLTSADGGLTLSVPAGAVDAATEFSIQSVENMLQTKGKAYRLLPEGTKFKKPVTLVYSYAGAGVRAEEAAYLFLVYQDAAGYYFQPKNLQHNAAAKTLSVQTTHFSDWTFTTRVELEVSGNVNNGTVELHKSESASFSLVKYLTGESTDAYKDEVPVLEDKDFATRAKINWSKSSASGTLLPLGANAVYAAPASIPQAESLVVTATVDDSNLGTDNLGQPIRQMTLVQPVQLLPDSPSANESFFELKEDGNTYRITNPRFFLAGGILSVIGDFPGRSIELSVWGGGVGSYAYGEPGATGKASINYTISGVAPFVHFHVDNCSQPKEIKYAQGQFTISRIAAAIGDYTEGSFTGEVFHADWCNSQQQKTVSGTFKIRKNY